MYKDIISALRLKKCEVTGTQEEKFDLHSLSKIDYRLLEVGDTSHCAKALCLQVRKGECLNRQEI